MDKQASAEQQNSKPAAKTGEFLIGGDLRVFRLGFGAMRITGKGIWGEPADRAEAIRVLRRAVELGINFIDTADSYGPHVSEQLIAEALHPYPAGLVIATKAGFDRSGPNQWVENGSPSICGPRAKEVCAAASGTDRSLPVASNRSESAGGRSTRHAEGFAGAGKNQAHRIVGS